MSRLKKAAKSVRKVRFYIRKIHEKDPQRTFPGITRPGRAQFDFGVTMNAKDFERAQKHIAKNKQKYLLAGHGSASLVASYFGTKFAQRKGKSGK